MSVKQTINNTTILFIVFVHINVKNLRFIIFILNSQSIVFSIYGCIYVCWYCFFKAPDSVTSLILKSGFDYTMGRWKGRDEAAGRAQRNKCLFIYMAELRLSNNGWVTLLPNEYLMFSLLKLETSKCRSCNLLFLRIRSFSLSKSPHYC